MIRMHFSLDSETSRQLGQLARAKQWSRSGVVRVAVNALYQRELAPLSFAKARMGRPKRKRRRK